MESRPKNSWGKAQNFVGKAQKFVGKDKTVETGLAPTLAHEVAHEFWCVRPESSWARPFLRFCPLF